MPIGRDIELKTLHFFLQLVKGTGRIVLLDFILWKISLWTTLISWPVCTNRIYALKCKGLDKWQEEAKQWNYNLVIWHCSCICGGILLQSNYNSSSKAGSWRQSAHRNSQITELGFDWDIYNIIFSQNKAENQIFLFCLLSNEGLINCHSKTKIFPDHFSHVFISGP